MTLILFAIGGLAALALIGGLIVLRRKPPRRPPGADIVIALPPERGAAGPVVAQIRSALAGHAPRVGVLTLSGPKISGDVESAERHLQTRAGSACDVAIWVARAADEAVTLRVTPMAAPADGDDHPARWALQDPIVAPTEPNTDIAAMVARLAILAAAAPDTRHQAFFNAQADAAEAVTAALSPDWSGVDRCRLRHMTALITLLRHRLAPAEGDDAVLDRAVGAAMLAHCDGQRAAAPEEWAAANAVLAHGLSAVTSEDAARANEAAAAVEAAFSTPAPYRPNTAAARLRLVAAEALTKAPGAAVAQLERAAHATATAQQTFTANGLPPLADRARLAAAQLHARAGEKTPGPNRLRAAVEAYRAVIDHDTEGADDNNAAMRAARLGLGETLASLGEREAKTTTLEAAVATFKDLLDTPEDTPDSAVFFARCRSGLGAALTLLGERTRQADHLAQAASALRLSVSALDAAGDPSAAAQARRWLTRAERAIAERRAAQFG